MWQNQKLLINPFPHTTILKQTTLNIFCQKIENLYNWMHNLWLVENIVAKGEIAYFEQFLLLSPCLYKSCLLQRCQKASIGWKGFKTISPFSTMLSNLICCKCIKICLPVGYQQLHVHGVLYFVMLQQGMQRDIEDWDDVLLVFTQVENVRLLLEAILVAI